MHEDALTPKTVAWITLSASLVVLVGLANYFVGSELAFSVFYLFPILLTARKAGVTAGILISCLSVMDWLWTEVYYAHRSHVYFFTPYWNALVVGVFFLIIMLFYARWEKEWRSARIDPRTQLPNRMAFFESVQIAVRLCQRYAHPVAVAYIDVDDFKRINDRWAYETGDKLLLEIAQGLQRHLRSTDLIGHMGGDEFAIVMPETYPGSSERSLRRIITELTQPRDSFGRITFSVGLAFFSPINVPVEEMVTIADLLMHEAKSAGKDRIVIRNAFVE